MKKIVINIISLILLVSISSCNCCRDLWYAEGEWVQKIDSEELVHVIQQYLAYLRHVKHLRLEDSRIFYNDYINTVRMEFTCQDILEVREARMLLVDVVEGLLAEINQNPILGSEVFNYPFSASQLEIYIDMESYYGLYLDPYFVGWIQLEKDVASYYAFDEKIDGLNYWDFRTEPYWKSRELVIQERAAESLFKDAFEIAENTPDPLVKEEYRPVIKCRPRYYNPYDTCQPIFK
jgi:hypothetical protein